MHVLTHTHTHTFKRTRSHATYAPAPKPPTYHRFNHFNYLVSAPQNAERSRAIVAVCLHVSAHTSCVYTYSMWEYKRTHNELRPRGLTTGRGALVCVCVSVHNNRIDFNTSPFGPYSKTMHARAERGSRRCARVCANRRRGAETRLRFGIVILARALIAAYRAVAPNNRRVSARLALLCHHHTVQPIFDWTTCSARSARFPHTLLYRM